MGNITSHAADKALMGENTNGLTLLENELVPVYATSTGEKVVYGTELHETLNVKSKFADWVKNRLNDCDALENKDFETFSKNLENGGRIKEYVILLDIAKEMAMLERNNIGKQVRRYFIEVDKRYKENIMPKDFPSALRAYADEVERRQIAEQEKEKLQQELDYSKDWLSIKRVAKMNGVDWKIFNWRKLKSVGLEMGYEVRKIFDANYGEVNTYHKDVWEACYPEYEI